MTRRLLLVAGVLLASPAMAQSTYVAGDVGADIVRVSHAEGAYQNPSDGGFEVLSGALRVGTAVASGWGVELEFVRSGETARDAGIFYPLYAAALQIANPGAPIGSALPVNFQPEIRQRQSSYNVAAWGRRPAGSSVDLVFLGGIALTRASTEITQPRVAASPTIVPFSSTYIEYAVRPLVGMDARVEMTSHLRLVPGIRAQGVTEGWIVRPSVALAWFF